MKRKEYGEVTNKIVNVEQVIARGQREPVIELVFKTSGYNRLDGHKVYIDYKCAKELISKLEVNIREVESKYHPYEFYNRLQRSADEILCGRD
jgi:hypothetical protein